MFKKVLVAEDFGGENLMITRTLSEKLNVPTVQEEFYCDKAYNRLKFASINNDPFELLITDLLFNQDHVTRRLCSGIELIEAIRPIQPNIKIIVYSMIDNPIKISDLFNTQRINGYVCKGRHALTQLETAIQTVFEGGNYLSPQIARTNRKNIFELDEFDILILKELEKGLSKKEIVLKFKRNNIAPNSESTLDKRVSKLFDEFGAKNTTSLIAKLIREGRI